MPINPESIRYKAPEDRGYARIWVKKERKTELVQAAKEKGFATVDDYLWHLHTRKD